MNKAIIIGSLGQDPEVRYTQAGKAVASFSVATSEKWKGQDGQMQEATEWHRIVAWDKLGELCGEYLEKGKKVSIVGKIQTRKWQDQSGNDKYTTEIVAKELEFLSPKGESGGSQYEQPSQGGYGGTGDDVIPF